MPVELVRVAKKSTKEYIQISYMYSPPSPQDGTPSSAFGFSAPGGTQGTPQPSTFVASVAVNPGQTYTITVGSVSGAVQFQFTQG